MTDIFITYKKYLPMSSAQELKDGVNKVFNDIAADLRGHDAKIEEISWISKTAKATVPEAEFEGLRKDLAPKGFVLDINTHRQLQPD